jgi:hypothetical protein
MSVLPGRTLQFAANVQGTGTFSSSVSWSVNASTGGNQAVGIIDATGLYTAPNRSPNPNTVNITATSTADTTKSGSASVLVGTAPFHITGVSISPKSVSLSAAGTQQFSDTVQGTGTFDSSVQWSAGGVAGGNSSVGTISPNGFYTAPNTVPFSTNISIQAASAIDPTVNATAMVSVAPGPPTITQISPSNADAGSPIQIFGTNLGGTATIYFPGPNGIQIAVPLGNTVGQAQLSTFVPLSSVSGPVYLQIQPQWGGAVLTSNSVTFTRIPHPRIRANRRDLSSGETVQFESRLLGENLSQSMSWTADIGSMSGTGAYTAPTNLATDEFAVVRGCVQPSQVCDYFRLGLRPFRLDPAVPILAAGQSLQLGAIAGASAISPAWNLEGPGAITPGGLYTTSTTIANAGGIPVTLTSGGVTEPASVGVTGAFPGVLNRVNDYVDLSVSPLMFGTSVSSVAVSGTRLYALSFIVFPGEFGLPPYQAIDVYDLADPQHPVWVDAIESAAAGDGSLLACGHFLYELSTNFSTSYVATFEISGPHPVLTTRKIDASASTYINGGCTTVTFPEGPSVPLNSPATVDVADLSTGTAVHTPYFLPLAKPAAAQLVSATANGSRLYLFSDTSSAGASQSHLSVYDLTKQPPMLLGDLTVPASDVQPRIAGHYLVATPPIRNGFDFTDIFDVTGSIPISAGTLPMGTFLDAGPNRAVFADAQSGRRVIDVSGSGSSIPFSSLFDVEVDNQGSAAVSGNLVFSAEALGGIVVYDVSVPGGPVWQSPLPFGSSLSNLAPRDQLVTPTDLYIAVGQQSSGGLLVYNLQTNPASFVGSFSTGSSVAQALAISGNTLFLGTVDNTYVLDVSTPANPTQIGVIGIGTTSLAVSGNFLFVGTVDNRLVVFDISNAASPVQTGAVNIPDLSIQMRTDGTRLFVADSSAGLLIFDISVPSTPTLLSSTQPSSNVLGVALDGNLALLAAWEAGFVIVDCSDPAHPVISGQAQLGTIDPFGTAEELLSHAAAVAVNGGIAYVGIDNFAPADFPNNGNATIFGFDYQRPNAPRIVSLSSSGSELREGIITMASSGSRLFAGGDTATFQMDITKPRNTINLFFLPDSLRPPVLSSLSFTKRTARPQSMRFIPQ